MYTYAFFESFYLPLYYNEQKYVLMNVYNNRILLNRQVSR